MKTKEGRETVLVVDYDPAVLVLIQHVLIGGGYRVLLAAKPADAVRIARQKHIRIDLAIIDVAVYGDSGGDLAQTMLGIRPDVRVLWMSGFVDEPFIRVKLHDEYAGFLSKPLRRDGLLPVVQQALEEAPRGWGMPAYQGERALTVDAGAC